MTRSARTRLGAARRRVVAAGLTALLVAGCSSTVSGTGSMATGPIGSRAPAGSTSASAIAHPDPVALHYGAAPQRNAGVTFQDDVVLVPAGGAAVRAVTDGGFTWWLDPSSPGVSQLANGKIMFVAGRGVGRVVNVRPENGDTVVTIVPTSITDIIKDGSFGGNAPVSLVNPLSYSAQGAFWANGGTTEDAGISRLLTPPAQGSPLPVPKLGGSGTVKAGGFTITGECCSHGLGARFTYDSADLLMVGRLVLTLSTAKPVARFNLDFLNGKVTTAELRLGAAAGIHADIDAAAKNFHPIDKYIPIPLDFSIPVVTILGVPLSATITQSIAVHTFFGSKNANIKASGDWTFAGGLGFTYNGTDFSITAPTSVTTKTSVLQSVSGIATGVTGIALDYIPRVTVGIGGFGFTAGVYFDLDVHLYLVRGSALGSPIVVCNVAQLALYFGYGIGYTIPRPVQKLINFFLKVFNVPPIESHGGTQPKSDLVFDKTAFEPDSHYCRKEWK